MAFRIPLPLLAVTAALVATAAAPVPKDPVPSPFGKPVPDKTGATFETDVRGRGVTLTMPRETDKPYVTERDATGVRHGVVPRTCRQFTGDFGATGRVECARPDGESTACRSAGGGIVVTDPAGPSTYFYLGAMVRNQGSIDENTWTSHLEYIQYFTPGVGGGQEPLQSSVALDPAKGVELRVTRTGSKVLFEYRQKDSWQQCGLEAELKLPETLLLGLAGYNALGETGTVRFTDLSVNQPKP